MKAALFATASLFLLAAGAARATDVSACYTIRDMDARTYCLAKAHRSPSMCYAIQNSDKRAQCMMDAK